MKANYWKKPRKNKYKHIIFLYIHFCVYKMTKWWINETEEAKFSFASLQKAPYCQILVFGLVMKKARQ